MGTKGCFGHIATYNPNNKICQLCNDCAACDESVSDRAQRLRKLGVSVELTKQRPAVTEPLEKPEREVKPVVSHMAGAPAVKRGIMTVKAKETYASVEKRGIDLKAGLMGLFNPLHDKPKFLACAFDRGLEGGYQKRGLAEQFCREFGWTRGTANSHVGICTSIFTALNLVKVDGQTVKTIEL